MKVYTRTGDDGTTALFGGERVAKSHPRIEAYGTVDETNAALGMARALLPTDAKFFSSADNLLQRLQEELFVLGGDLASPHETKYPIPRITSEHVVGLEKEIDRMEADLPALKHFVLPGGHPAAAAVHLARTVSRRAERLIVDAAHLEPISSNAAHYANRLSDLLFVFARWINHQANAPELKWVPVANRD
ncbi:cob(I)yrinic acid a,c-diamide adenosyltransferase [soil metagenome]